MLSFKTYAVKNQKNTLQKVGRLSLGTLFGAGGGLNTPKNLALPGAARRISLDDETINNTLISGACRVVDGRPVETVHIDWMSCLI